MNILVQFCSVRYQHLRYSEYNNLSHFWTRSHPREMPTKIALSARPSIRPYECNNIKSAKRISMKLRTEEFYGKKNGLLQFWLKSEEKIMDIIPIPASNSVRNSSVNAKFLPEIKMFRTTAMERNLKAHFRPNIFFRKFYDFSIQ